MHTELYCKTLDNLEKIESIRAIHEAYLQLNAIEKRFEGDCVIYNNKPVLRNLQKCLENAGHIGFN